MLRAALPSIVSRSPQETDAIGAILAKSVYSGLLVLLRGDLGAGKTRLVRAIGGALGAGNVKSPTFAIESVHSLPGQSGKNFSLVHADLYRLQETEKAVMQLEEYLDDGGAVLVEWGEKWDKPPLSDRWDIALSQVGDDARDLRFSAYGGDAIASLSNAFAEMLFFLEDDSPCR